ncbi:MAG: ABC transporter permease, partial [Chloroflexota bacterium]
MLKTKAGGFVFQLVAFLLAMGFVSLILLAVGASPMEAYKNMLTGSVGSMRKFAEVLVSFVPMLLVTAGLLITFSAGLWNIGVEGQIVLGAIGSVWVLR